MKRTSNPRRLFTLFAIAVAACSSTSGMRDAAVDRGSDVAPSSDGGGHDTGGAGAAGSTSDAGGEAASAGVGGGAGSRCASYGESCSDAKPCCVPLICAGGCTMGVSDRSIKRDFAPVDDDAILRSLMTLPISTWRYRTDDAGTRHMGPTAQDFRSTFHLGPSDKFIYQVDGDGVALSAIRSLNARVARLDEENAALKRELSRLRTELHQRRRFVEDSAVRVNR